MSKQGEFGSIIPKIGEIVKIDGNKVVDAEGDEWDANLLRLNQDLGGGYEACIVKSTRPRTRKTK